MSNTNPPGERNSVTSSSTTSVDENQSEDEELQRLKEADSEDEIEAGINEDKLEGLPVKEPPKLKRGSTSTSILSRKSTVASITRSMAALDADETAIREVSSDAESSTESSLVGTDWVEQQMASPDLPQDYWQVQKLVKYIKIGNQTATIIALSALRDFDLKDDLVQRALKESGGIEVLLNILETDEDRCKIASLLCLRNLTYNREISRTVFNMRGLETLVECLKDPSKDIKLLTAETISNVCKLRKARRVMRMGDGIAQLVDMLETPDQDWELARSGALALWALARSTKNKEAIRKSGAISLLSKLMMCEEVDVVIPVVGILQECASDPTFREAIRTQGLLPQFVFGLSSENEELVQFCAQAICMCAVDEESREVVYHLGAVEPLLKIMQNTELRKNKPLLIAATGAIWKCCSSIFRKGSSSVSSIVVPESPSPTGFGGFSSSAWDMSTEGIIHLLVTLLHDQHEDVLINVSGSLYEIAKADLDYNAQVIKKANAIPPLLSLLTRSNTDLLMNTTKAIGELARDTECRMEMEQLDGFRLVWSLLRHPSSTVQAGAAWAICPYVEHAENAGKMVKNYVGGLEAIVQLLASSNPEVQAAVAYAIGCIARNPDNLSIMTDHAVVEFLAKLASTPKPEDNTLKICLSTAIAHCSLCGENSKEFGKLHAVAPICGYLSSSKNPLVHRAAARALCALSSYPRNCYIIHQCGVVPILIDLSGSEDEELRNSVAGIMSNIRKLALCVESVRLIS